MMKSTATQQQDTISDMKSPKSCTAGICMKTKNVGLGSKKCWDRKPRETERYLEEPENSSYCSQSW